MSKTIGQVNEEGVFELKTTFDPQNSNDMEQMMKLIHDEEMNAKVEDHDENSVEVVYRPSDLSRYGFR
jgi:hypothetical protein